MVSDIFVHTWVNQNTNVAQMCRDVLFSVALHFNYVTFHFPCAASRSLALIHVYRSVNQIGMHAIMLYDIHPLLNTNCPYWPRPSPRDSGAVKCMSSLQPTLSHEPWSSNVTINQIKWTFFIPPCQASRGFPSIKPIWCVFFQRGSTQDVSQAYHVKI